MWVRSALLAVGLWAGLLALAPQLQRLQVFANICFEDGCCSCGKRCYNGGCTLNDSACDWLCFNTPTPIAAPNPPTPVPNATATPTPNPAHSPTPLPPNFPTPTNDPGGCNYICDVDCSPGATSSYWQSRGWDSNDPKCCLVCAAADWCQYSGWSCTGSNTCWQHGTRSCVNGGLGISDYSGSILIGFCQVRHHLSANRSGQQCFDTIPHRG